LNPDIEAKQIDIEIGARLRVARKARGFSQTELGDSIGVTFQQIQKYERGANRISCSALILLAGALQVPPADILGLKSTDTSELDWDLLSVEGTEDLLHAYGAIRSSKLRSIVRDIARELAQQPDAASEMIEGPRRRHATP
jgi:transcriptional regulator with XRE-family HTH domain